MHINYCDGTGPMSVCRMINNPTGQQFCEFSVEATAPNRTENKYCMHLSKAVEGHCDCAAAQWDAKHDKPRKEAIPLSEEEVFDITNRDTYPEYRTEGGDLYV